MLWFLSTRTDRTDSFLVFERGDYASERPRARECVRARRGLVLEIDPAARPHTHARALGRPRIMAFATIGAPMTFTVRAARHAKKKATKGHRDTRPKKTSPSQRRRTPTEYPTVDPASVPAVMTVVSK